MRHDRVSRRPKRLRTRGHQRLNRSERAKASEASHIPGSPDADLVPSADDRALPLVVAPPIDGPDPPGPRVGSLWPPICRVRFDPVVPRGWAEIRRMLAAGEYVDGQMLAAALMAHRRQSVDRRVLQYLCTSAGSFAAEFAVLRPGLTVITLDVQSHSDELFAEMPRGAASARP